jgi:allantoinase
MHDLLIRQATLPTLETADIAILNGTITNIQPEILESAKTVIDARGLHVLPGVVDVHVHFNQPGREDWEGIRSGSSAFAAGGGTVFVDMPLNSSPVTIDAASFDTKLEVMRRESVTDFALWGGLVPGNLERLPELAERGVVGFKAFMCNSGLDEFGSVDDHTLLEGMRVAASLGLPVAVHAENDAIPRALSAQFQDRGEVNARAYLNSRPAIVELEAISRALLFAQETGCALHVVHLSTARGVRMIADARVRGVNVTAETCPHYLWFCDDDLERLGAVLKCAPPVRDARERDALWQEVLEGRVDIVGSDHSPALPSMKTGADFFKIWGGISGVQSTLNAMLTAGHHARGLALEAICAMLGANPAQRFALPRKGRLEVGFDADLALVNLGESFRLEDVLYRHRQSPYLGASFTGRVARTLVRGRTVWDGEKVNLEARGAFVRPFEARDHGGA